jgi:hypothetical protein
VPRTLAATSTCCTGDRCRERKPHSVDELLSEIERLFVMPDKPALAARAPSRSSCWCLPMTLHQEDKTNDD